MCVCVWNWENSIHSAFHMWFTQWKSWRKWLRALRITNLIMFVCLVWALALCVCWCMTEGTIFILQIEFEPIWAYIRIIYVWEKGDAMHNRTTIVPIEAIEITIKQHEWMFRKHRKRAFHSNYELRSWYLSFATTFYAHFQSNRGHFELAKKKNKREIKPYRLGGMLDWIVLDRWMNDRTTAGH